MKKIIKNQGFTLVEIMIALGILSVISYGLMKMLSDTTKTQKTLEVKDSMSQLQREIITFLASEQNCSASLAGKHNGDPVSILYKATNTGVVPKFYSNIEIGKSKISIDSMSIQNVELIGDGSHSKANLKVIMKKLSKDALGGKQIPFDIKLSANLCTTSLLIKPTLADIQTACAGGSKKITGGLKAWGGQFWATCQDCSGAVNSNTANISSCQSMGGGSGGVDANDVSKLTCINMGGIFNDATNSCNVDDKNAKASCVTLGGVYDDASKLCAIGDGVVSLQSKLCGLETKFLGETLAGGMTTLCSPNAQVQGTGLVNGVHTKSDCTKQGGTVVSNFCKFNSGGCPGGWNQYNGWASWSGGSFQGNDDSNRSGCSTCGGSDCSFGAVAFAAGTGQPSCNVEDCSWAHGNASTNRCERSYSTRTIYSSRTAIGCY